MNLNNLIETSKLDIINSDLLNELKYYPQIKKNVSYIVAIVLLNEQNQICLAQEAKLSCYKKWYLPAGKVEPNETLNQAAIREASEETGFMILPLRLFNIELGSTGNWFRFSFLARIVGGALKTKPDQESLCAGWFDLTELNQVDLRSNDFFRLVELGVSLYNSYGFNSFNLSESKYTSLKERFLLPKDVSNHLIVYGFVLLNETLDSCLLKADYSVPACIIASYITNNYNLSYVIRNILFPRCFKLINNRNVDYKCVGVSSVSFNADNHDNQHGIHIVFVLNILNEKSYEVNDLFSWIKLDNRFDISNLMNLMVH